LWDVNWKNLEIENRIEGNCQNGGTFLTCKESGHNKKLNNPFWLIVWLSIIPLGCSFLVGIFSELKWIGQIGLSGLVVISILIMFFLPKFNEENRTEG